MTFGKKSALRKFRHPIVEELEKNRENIQNALNKGIGPEFAIVKILVVDEKMKILINDAETFVYSIKDMPHNVQWHCFAIITIFLGELGVAKGVLVGRL